MWMDVLLLLILAICVATDLWNRKIYNIIIFPGLILTIVLHIIFGGWQELSSSLLGLSVGLGVLLIPYLMGGMGAGDVKLLALIGAMKGSSVVLITALYMALLGGAIAILILLFRKGAFHRIKSILYSLYCLRFGLRMPILIKGELQTSYPYGVAIAGGALLCLWL